MDEADVLGDRIAIMSKGSLKCCGSPLFLKSKYGSGYSLVINKKKASQVEANSNQESKEDIKTSTDQPPAYDEQQLNIDSSNNIISLVKSVIPNAQLSSNINSEISFMLPTEVTIRFSDLFERLEKMKESLNILTIGISVTTLEEVFLRIGDNENTDDTDVKTVNEPIVSDLTASNPVYVSDSNGFHQTEANNMNVNHVSGEIIDDYGLWIGSKGIHRVGPFELLANQFEALFKKRFIHSIRNVSLIVSQLIIPIAVLLINLLYLKYAPIKPGDSPLLQIDIGRYGNNFVPYDLKINNQSSNLVKGYNIKCYVFNFNLVHKINAMSIGLGL